MLKKYEPVCYELLRPEQVLEIRNRYPIAYIPAGSLEWHGIQNPLGTDSLKAHAVCCEAALKFGGIVLPPFYQGLLGVNNWGPAGWTGYTLSFNDDEMFAKAMIGVCKALIYGKWKVIVGVTGHDVKPQRDTMETAIKKVTDGKNSSGFAVMEGELHNPDSALNLTMDHAGAWETSCMMYAYPDKVDLRRLKGWDLSDIGSHSKNLSEVISGIGGLNPLQYASKKTGRKIIERMGNLIGIRAFEILKKLN